MYSLITFATQWGSKHGGINSFNTDFLTAFGVAYHLQAQVICIVASATSEEIEEARNAHVSLVPLPYPPQEKLFSAAQAQAGIEALKHRGITFDPDSTVWLGHDRTSGIAANEAAKLAGGRSALIHHMSYDHYESYAENSATAYKKSQDQKEMFQMADLVLAVGPLLRDAVDSLLGNSKPVHMLIPGLAEIDSRPAPKTFTAFLSGRLSDDAARIKQGHLGIAAFSQAHREAREHGMPEGLCQKPKLVLRGVNFEADAAPAKPGETVKDPETELKKFAEEYASGVINLQALPYTQNRQELFQQLAASSVALMPSWHEGFGLVAWEAIAAGVPLIVSKESGVFLFLDEVFPGAGPGCVYPINPAGAVEKPYFSDDDLKQVVAALNKVAVNPDKARSQAGILRGLVSQYTWPSCAESAVQAFGWTLQKGSIPDPSPVSSIPPPESVLQDIAGPLLMPVKRWQTGAVLADSQLLRAEEALVPFDPARQPDLDKLNAWLDDANYPQAVRLICGAGGLGKTRLALELCQQRLAKGWQAGLLDNDLDAKSLAGVWQTLHNLNQPLLIVIDYAETRQPILLGLVKAILQAPAEQPVRILLLARNGGEWWDNLPGKDKDCEAFLGGYATSGPYHLPALHNEIRDRRQAYQLALQAFAEALNVSAPDVAPDLTGEHFGRPLYLQMAALLALHGERPTTAQGLTKALLNHERRYWGRSLAGTDLPEPERDAEQLLALITLAGGFSTPKAVQEYWHKASGNSLSTPVFNQLFHSLEPLYPGKQGLQAVRPDLLGEALVAQALFRPTASDLLDAVLTNQADLPVRRHALTVIARLSGQYHELHETLVEGLARHFAHCCQELVGVAKETSSDLPMLAETAFNRLTSNVKSQIAGLLESHLHEESVQLAGVYCAISEYLAGKAREKHQKKPADVEVLNEYARALGNYAEELSRAGHNNKALSLSLEGLNVFEKLRRLNRQRFEPDYATALSNNANYLGEAGQSQEALVHARQALEIRRKLTEKKPDRFKPDYATSLSNYSIFLCDVGENQEALEPAKQALEIRRELALKHPDHFEADYATSLNNYAIRLSEVGQDREALAHAGQALEMRRTLAKKNPDRFEPDYASSLNNYANNLSEAGRDQDALEHTRRGLEIFRALAQKNLDRFESSYTMALNNYAIRLSEAGHDLEALEYARQALKIHQNPTHNNPVRFAADSFLSICTVRFQEWLLEQPDSFVERGERGGISETVPEHRRSYLLAYQAFVDGCLVADKRAEAFELLLALWDGLTRANKYIIEEYWLCAAAWCAAFDPSAVAHLDWRADWHRYISRRKGRLPCWMATVAQRLGFRWPEWQADSEAK